MHEELKPENRALFESVLGEWFDPNAETARLTWGELSRLLDAARTEAPAPQGEGGEERPLSKRLRALTRQADVWAEVAEEGDQGTEPLPAMLRAVRELLKYARYAANIERALASSSAPQGETPKRGELRIVNGSLCRFIERELEGDKWEILGPWPAPQGDVEGVDLEGLEKALEPFADEFGEGIPRPDDWRVFGNLNLGDFRRAAEALSALRSRSGVGERAHV